MQIDADDAGVLADLWAYGLVGAAALDAPALIARRAARVAQARLGIVAIVQAGRLWTLGSSADDARRPAEAKPFMQRIVAQNRPAVISDMRLALPGWARTAVREGSPLRFLAGFPLTVSGGRTIGVLCVLDERAGAPFAPEIADGLESLAQEASEWLDARRRCLAEDRAASSLDLAA